MEIHDKDGKRINPASEDTFKDGTAKMQIANPDGNSLSLQHTVFDSVDGLSDGDFTLPGNIPFKIKNDNEEAVSLEVKPAGLGKWVLTNFHPGWNIEIVVAIKQNALVTNLIWGL